MSKRKFRLPERLIPKPEKIVKRGIYEMINIATGSKTKTKDYNKRIKKGKF